MAVYVDINWLDFDTGAVYYSDRIKISDTISYDRYRKTYQNLRFDDYYIINEAKNKIIKYINNSPRHQYFDAKVANDFLPFIFVEAEIFLDNPKK